MIYYLYKSEVGVCKSVFHNHTFEYENCLDKGDEKVSLEMIPVYCCQKELSVYLYHEYCCSYNELLSQNRFSMFILLLLVCINCLVFSITTMLNIYISLLTFTSKSSEDIDLNSIKPKPLFPLLGGATSSVDSSKSSKSAESTEGDKPRSMSMLEIKDSDTEIKQLRRMSSNGGIGLGFAQYFRQFQLRAKKEIAQIGAAPKIEIEVIACTWCPKIKKGKKDLQESSSTEKSTAQSAKSTTAKSKTPTKSKKGSKSKKVPKLKKTPKSKGASKKKATKPKSKTISSKAKKKRKSSDSAYSRDSRSSTGSAESGSSLSSIDSTSSTESGSEYDFD